MAWNPSKTFKGTSVADAAGAVTGWGAGASLPMQQTDFGKGSAYSALFGQDPKGVGPYQGFQAPDWQGITDANGRLQSQYDFTPQQLTGNYGYDPRTVDLSKYGKSQGAQTALNSLYDRANSVGDSPWAKLQLDRMGIEQMQANEDARAQSATSSANALSTLAMRGGLSGGARERALTSANRDLARSQNALARQASVDRLNLRATDDQQRLGLQKDLQGIDLQDRQFRSGIDQFNVGQVNAASQFNGTMGYQKDAFNTGAVNDATKFNLNNTIGDQRAKFGYQTGVWQTMMGDKANHANADAIARSGGRGGIFGSLGLG